MMAEFTEICGDIISLIVTVPSPQLGAKFRPGVVRFAQQILNKELSRLVQNRNTNKQ